MSTKLELILEGTNPILPIDTAMTPTVEDLVAHIEKVADIDGRSVVELDLPRFGGRLVIVRCSNFESGSSFRN